MLYPFFWQRGKVEHNQGELTAVTVKQIFCPKPKSTVENALAWGLSPQLPDKTQMQCSEINSSLARSDGQGRQGQPLWVLYSSLQWMQIVHLQCQLQGEEPWHSPELAQAKTQIHAPGLASSSKFPLLPILAWQVTPNPRPLGSEAT